MKRIITINIIRILLLFWLASPVQAEVLSMSEQSAQIATSSISAEIVVVDQRKEKLQEFLLFHNSPLATYAGVFVDKAEEYQLFDWRLVPAITGVESTFGKAGPVSSYNAYGWGNGSIVFTSWENSIDVVSKAIKEKYMDRGLDTVEKIAPVYAPPSHTWAFKINKFMAEIANFAPHTSEQLRLSL